MAQKAFHDAGRFARVGVKTFAFTWTSLVLICTSLICLLGAWVYRRRRGRQNNITNKRDSLNQNLIPTRAPGSVSYGDVSGHGGDGGFYHEKQRGVPDYYRPATAGGGGGYGDERGGYRAEPRRGLAGVVDGEYTVPGARVGNRDVGGERADHVHLNTARDQSAPPAGTVARFDEEQVVRNPEIGRGSGDTKI